MKPLPFLIPKSSLHTIHLQVDHQPYLYDYLHQHPELQITLIKAGEGQLIIGDYVGRFQVGDIFIIGSNIPHVFKNDKEYYQNPPVQLAHAISVYFTWQAFGKDLWTLPEFAPIYQRRTKLKKGLKVNSAPSITHQIESLWQLEGIARIFGLFQLLEDLMALENVKLLTPAFDLQLNQTQGNRLDDIYRYTLNNYHQPIRLEALAEISCLTVSSFCRYFKKSTRKSYFEFLNEIRIGEAQRLLHKAKDLSVSQIAYQVGFQNLAYFNRQFKKLTLMTPSEYRKRESFVHL